MSHYKPYPAYKDSGVEWLGRVPEHWLPTSLSYLAEYINGYPFAPEQWSQEGLPIIRIAQLTGKPFDNYFDGKLPERVKVRDGDLLFSWSATIDCFIWAQGDAWLNQHIFRVIPSSEVELQYLYHLIRHVAPKLADFDAHGSTMRHIKKESLKEKLFIPTVGEQTKISAHLDRETARIDALIEKKTRFIELLREKRQALITHAVTKGLDPNVTMKDSGVEWLGKVPEHWEMVPLKYVTPSLTVGIVVNPSDYVADEGLPFLYGGDIGEGVIFAESARRISPEHSQRNAKTRLNAGDLVTVRVGAPGVTAVVPPECEGGNCASVMLIRRGEFNSDWLCYTMNSRVVRYQVEVVQYGAAQEQFNISHAVDFLIPVPPVEEQSQIASVLNQEGRRVDALLSKTECSIELLKERRSALITAAVTGQIDLREAV